jgi:hypothetical protein
MSRAAGEGGHISTHAPVERAGHVENASSPRTAPRNDIGEEGTGVRPGVVPGAGRPAGEGGHISTHAPVERAGHVENASSPRTAPRNDMDGGLRIALRQKEENLVEAAMSEGGNMFDLLSGHYAPCLIDRPVALLTHFLESLNIVFKRIGGASFMNLKTFRCLPSLLGRYPRKFI